METVAPAAVVGVLLVVAWMLDRYYAQRSHERAEAEARRQTEADIAAAVATAVEEERGRHKAFEPRSSPSLHELFATKREHHELARRVDQLAEDAEKRIVRLHDRITDLDDAIAATPQKTIDLLRATKGLLP